MTRTAHLEVACHRAAAQRRWCWAPRTLIALALAMAPARRSTPPPACDGSGPSTTARRSSGTPRTIRPSRTTRPGTATCVASLGRAQRDRRVSGDRRGRRRGIDRLVGAAAASWSRPRTASRYRAARRRSDRLRGPSDPDLHRALHARDDAVARVVGLRAGVAGCARRSDRLEAGAARAGERAPGRGGLPIAVRPARTRRSGSRSTSAAIAPPGLYRGDDRDPARTARRARVPIELEVFDFALPDENSMHAMLFYSSDQPELLSRPQPRSPPTTASRIATASSWCTRTTSRRCRQRVGPVLRRGLHARARLRRARRGHRQRASRRVRSTGRAALRRSRERLGAQRRVDDVPPREAAARDHVPLHARRAAPARVSAHPASSRRTSTRIPGRAARCRSSSRSAYVDALDAAIDIWCSGPKGFELDRVARGAGARPAVLVLQRRPAGRRRDHHRCARHRRARDDLGRVQARRRASTSTGTRCTGGTTRRSRASANQNVWAEQHHVRQPRPAEQAARRSGLHPRRRRADLSGRGASCTRRRTAACPGRSRRSSSPTSGAGCRTIST